MCICGWCVYVSGWFKNECNKSEREVKQESTFGHKTENGFALFARARKREVVVLKQIE